MHSGCLVRRLYTSQRLVFPSGVDQYCPFIQIFSKRLEETEGNQPSFYLWQQWIPYNQMLCWCFIHYPFSVSPPTYFLFSSKNISAGKVRQQTALAPETPQAVIQSGALGSLPTPQTPSSPSCGEDRVLAPRTAPPFVLLVQTPLQHVYMWVWK